MGRGWEGGRGGDSYKTGGGGGGGPLLKIPLSNHKNTKH